MNTRRYPRTMQQAFGPHTDHRLHPMPQQPSTAERIYGVLLATVIGVMLAASLVHWWSS